MSSSFFMQYPNLNKNKKKKRNETEVASTPNLWSEHLLQVTSNPMEHSSDYQYHKIKK